MAAFDPVLKQFVANGSFLTVADMNTGTLSPDKAFVTYAPIIAPQFQGSVIGINGVSPVHPTMTVTDGLIDQKASDIYYDVNGMQFRFLSDSYLTATTWLGVTRTGMAATVVTVTAPVINLVGTAKVAGYPIFHSGNLSFGTGLTLTNGVLTSIGGVGGGSSPIATATTVGTVKPGPLATLALSSDGSGSIDVVAQNVTAGSPPATSSALRLVMDTGLSITGDQVKTLVGSTPTSVATATTVGTVKLGTTNSLTILPDGSLDVSAQAITAGTIPTAVGGFRLLTDSGQSITGELLIAWIKGLLGTTSITPVLALQKSVYWRILIHSTSVPASAYGDIPAMTEIVFAGVPYGPSLTTGGAASSSGDNGSSISANAFDGNMSTAWASSIKSPPNDSYIQYTFTSSVAVAEVRLTTQNSSYGISQAFGTWDLQLSSDNVTFTTVKSFTSAPWTVGQTQTFSVTSSTAATAYTTGLSAASGTVGTAFTVTFTPTNGPWPANEVITPTSTLAGTFNPTTITVSGSTAGTTVFTPSAAGTGTINSTTSPSLTNTSGGQTYTATAAAAASAFPMVFNGPAGAPTGIQALTACPGSTTSGVVLNGSGGLVLGGSAYNTMYFAAAGKLPAGGKTTVTATTNATPYVGLIMCEDGTGTHYYLFVDHSGNYQLLGANNVAVVPAGTIASYVNTPGTIGLYTDTTRTPNYVGINYGGVMVAEAQVSSLLPPGYVGVAKASAANTSDFITQITVTQ